MCERLAQIDPRELPGYDERCETCGDVFTIEGRCTCNIDSDSQPVDWSQYFNGDDMI